MKNKELLLNKTETWGRKFKFSEKIINLIEKDSDFVLDEIDDEIEKFRKSLDSSVIQEIFMIFEKYPQFHFGIPGSLTHYVESFYKQGDTYEKELMASLNRTPTELTLFMLNRLINGTEDKVKKSMYTRERERIKLKVKYEK